MAKKKTSNLSNLINTSPKKLLVFLLAFVVIGGGVMAYRSFAATPNLTVTSLAPEVVFSPTLLQGNPPVKLPTKIVAKATAQYFNPSADWKPRSYTKLCQKVILQKYSGKDSGDSEKIWENVITSKVVCVDRLSKNSTKGSATSVLVEYDLPLTTKTKIPPSEPPTSTACPLYQTYSEAWLVDVRRLDIPSHVSAIVAICDDGTVVEAQG